MAAARGDPGRRPGPVFTVQSANCRSAPCRDNLNSGNNSRYSRESPRCKVILTNDRITSTFSKNIIKKSSGFSRDNSRDVLAEVTVDTPLTGSYKEINSSDPRNEQVRDSYFFFRKIGII